MTNKTQELHKKLTKAFNAQDEAGIRAICANNMEYVAPGDMTGKGVDAYVEFCRSWWTAFPDARVRTDRLHVTDDEAAGTDDEHQLLLDGNAGHHVLDARIVAARGNVDAVEQLDLVRHRGF